MYKIAICEDERYFADQIIEKLKVYQEKEKVRFKIDYYTSVEDLFKQGYDQYHAVFLDILMKEMTGMEAAKIIYSQNEKIKIVFITSCEQYWQDGYCVNAFRYLLKPIDEEKFRLCIKDLLVMIDRIDSSITVRHEGGVERIAVATIKYIETVGRKVEIHTLDKVYCSSYSLSYWYEKLERYGFEFSHQSYLVNMKYIIRIEKDKVVLKGGEEAYVSQRKLKLLKEKFIMYLQSA